MATSSERPWSLKPAGFLLLITGWILVLFALVLLKQPAARGGFLAAGLGVETLGLVLAARSFVAPRPERH